MPTKKREWPSSKTSSPTHHQPKPPILSEPLEKSSFDGFFSGRLPTKVLGIRKQRGLEQAERYLTMTLLYSAINFTVPNLSHFLSKHWELAGD